MDLPLEIIELNMQAASINLPNKTIEAWNSCPDNWNQAKRERNLKTISISLFSNFSENGVKPLASAVAVVFHRYTGHESVQFLIQQPSTSQNAEAPGVYKIAKFNFTNLTSFHDLLTQCDQNSSQSFGVQEVKSVETEQNLDLGYVFRFIVGSKQWQEPTNCEILFLLESQENEIKTSDFNFVLEYNSELYLESQMLRLASHVSNILKNGLFAPDEPILTLEILSAEERNKVLYEFNTIRPDNLDFLKNEETSSLLGAFYHSVRSRKDEIALVEGMVGTQKDLNLTFGQLYAHAQLVSRFIELKLNKFETSSSKFLATFLPQGLHLISTSLASLMLNKTVAVIHSSYAPKQVEKCLNTLEFPLLVTTKDKILETSLWNYKYIFLIDEQEIENMGKLIEVKGKNNEIQNPVLSDLENNNKQPNYKFTETIDPERKNSAVRRPIREAQQKASATMQHVNDPKHKNFDVLNIINELRKPSQNATPYCFFTSGSTGEPKAVLVREIAILNTAEFCKTEFGINSSSRSMCMMAPGFLPSIVDVWNTLCCGGCMFIPPEDVRLNMSKLKPWIYDHNITNFFTSCAVLKLILHDSLDNGHYLSKVKWILATGEQYPFHGTIPGQVKFSFNYGSTEASKIASMPLPDGTIRGMPPVGYTVPNTQAYILDSHRNLVGIGVVGDVWVSGLGLMAEYVNQGTEAKNVFLENPFRSGSRLYSIGDVGYWGEDGKLFVLGRKDAQVKIHGMRLELGEVESVLQQFEEIDQAVVVLRKLESAKHVVAFCKISGENQPNMKELYTFLEARLQRHAIPLEINFVHEFPRTPSGKIARNTLTTLVNSEAQNETQDIKTSADSTIYDRVRNIWAQAIGIPRSYVRPASNFFLLGGNSVLAAQVIQTLGQDFPNIKLASLFAHPILSDFLRVILSGYLNKETIDFDLEAKLTFPISMTCDPPKLETDKHRFRKILLTGVTGYLGPSLLQQLLFKTSADTVIICIVRAPTNKTARERFLNVLTSQQFKYLDNEANSDRVKILAGDLTKPDFGLNVLQYEALCRAVDVIYHGAADVNFVKPYSDLRSTTVAMTRNVIKFAVTEKQKWVHYMSTIAVFDGIPLPEGCDTYLATEDRLPEEIRVNNMSAGYNQSKWVSEKMIWNAIDCGVGGTIYRIGEIGSHTKLQLVNRDDALAGFVLACKELQKLPDGKISVPYVSLDSAAEMITELSLRARKNKEFAQVYHIVESEVEVMDLVNIYGEQNCSLVPIALWEEEFLQGTTFKTKGNVAAWLLLNSIKQTKDTIRTGSPIRGIQYCTKKTNFQITQEQRAENLSQYMKTLFNCN